MAFLLNFVYGIFIGFGAILPGVSSGVFCVIFGIYEKILNSVVHFFKDFKKNLLFLAPLGLGAVLGIVLFGNVVKYLFSNYQFFVSYVFIGLILGTLPSVFKQASPSGIVNIRSLIPMFLSLGFGILLIFFEKNFSAYTSVYSCNWLYLCFAGFLMSARNCYSWH